LSTNRKYNPNSTFNDIELNGIYELSLTNNISRIDKVRLSLYFNVVDGVATSVTQGTLYRMERFYLETTANKTTTISANSTNTEYPSALAVKNYVDSQISGAIGGAY
jgi:hypothetical protein